MRQVQKGFTLIELVFVIVIIGILAAFAIPKFVDLTTDARKATVHGLLGTVRAASEQVKAMAIAEGKDDDASTTVTVEGVAVDIAYGYPKGTAAGIQAAVLATSDFTPAAAAGVASWQLASADTPGSCKVEYDATPLTADDARPVITETITDC